MADTLLQLAHQYCKLFHKDDYRKNSGKPFSSHPIAVMDKLVQYGYADNATKCIALLHDSVEDTSLIMTEIKDRFGFEIANGVYVLSRNTFEDKLVGFTDDLLDQPLDDSTRYKLRLSFARRKVQRVKIADMIHNTEDLLQMPESGAKSKIYDAESFYIPLGKEIAKVMVEELIENIANYKRMV
jgi:GTP diphosphokinase / guanosine-3',5'-bis(diphosphate) 3'-diphosphatase